MIFGIGSGLFFSYMPFVKVNGLPVTSFRPLPGNIFSRAAKRLGITFYRRKFRSPAESMAVLDKFLSEGRPVGLQVGVYHLDYFPPLYRFHFNAHNLVVFGKDGDQYLISDPVMETPTALTTDRLQLVRYAKGAFAPKGQMYFPSRIPDTLNLKPAIYAGLKQTCNDMLDIPIPLFGVKGIAYLAGRMRKWPQRLSDRAASAYMGQVIRAQEEIGTGGAGFRFMFAAFLQESAGIFGLDWLNTFALQMTEIGDLWREFAVAASRIVKNRAGEEQSYNYTADLLYTIYEKEKAFFQSLRARLPELKSTIDN